MTLDSPSRSTLLLDSRLVQPPRQRLGALDVPTAGSRHQHVVRARALGQLDRATLPMFTEELVAAGRSGFAASSWASAPAIELDLSGLIFMCTCGLAALNEAWQHLDDLGGRLCLTGPRPQVLYVLDVAIFSGWIPAELECDQDHPWPVMATPTGSSAGHRHRVHLAPARTRLPAEPAPLARVLQIPPTPATPKHPGSAA